MSAAKTLEPNPHVTLTLDELAKMQAVAGIHLTFSLTLACPLKCAHCIVEAGPELRKTTMPVDVARHYAEQMPELFDYGIRIVSFTGGEPLLAREQLTVLSNAASRAGMTTGMVTAAHWATSEDSAKKIVESLPGIDVWDVSIDSYHEEFLSFDRVRTAYQAAKTIGKRSILRFTHHDPLTSSDKRILDFIKGFAEEGDICSQRIRSAGRASDLPVIEAHDEPTFAKPCWTKGLVIRYDGSMAPCCISLVEDRQHPFQFGDARTRPLTEIHADYMSHPLLQMIRVLGFGEVMRWLKEAGMDEHELGPLPQDVCDLCPRVVSNSRWAPYLTNRAAEPQNRLRIAILASRMLEEHTMLQRTVRELESQADQIEGFELVAALAAETEA
jgi:pyruvate-formate lyase-activating enzyme